MKPSRRFLRYILFAVLAVWLPAVAETETVSENAVRAVLLYNFLKFADLPASEPDRKTLDICVATGNPELLAAMEQLDDRQIRGRSLSVHGFKEDTSCDAIYVDSRARWRLIAERESASRALTVGVYPGFINDGGMVEVDIQQTRTRFDININQARRAGIRIYPQLLRMARRVFE